MKGTVAPSSSSETVAATWSWSIRSSWAIKGIAKSIILVPVISYVISGGWLDEFGDIGAVRVTLRAT